MKKPIVDPVQLTADLVRCPSVTPREGGAITLLETLLSDAGFACTRIERAGSPTCSRAGARRAPPGALASTAIPMWCRSVTRRPGACRLRRRREGRQALGARRDRHEVGGRGLRRGGDRSCDPYAAEDGAVIVTITGDRGGRCRGRHQRDPRLDGRRRRAHGCLRGRRADLPRDPGRHDQDRAARVDDGVVHHHRQAVGHSAYPHRACNPMPAMARLMDRLSSRQLDEGTEHFDPSTLAVVTIDTATRRATSFPRRPARR